jgi:hypothetical protein
MPGTPALLLALAAASGAPADTQAGAGANPADALAACRSIADSAARLACFDKTAEAFVRARENKEVVVLERAEIQKTRRSLFGFSLPKIKLFGGGDDGEEELKEITGKVASVGVAERDRWLVRLEDESRWQTIEPAVFPPRTGDNARIKRAAMGSFMATFNGGRSVRVKRVD